MRVITGKARGRTLVTPDGYRTRPTSEKVKEALFSILHFELEGRRVLDMFAGSGQLGIEALSRGAAFCVFCETDRRALDCVRKNVKHCGFEDSAFVSQSDGLAYASKGERFDIILADPPYAEGLHEKILSCVSAFDTLNNGGIMVLESDKAAELPDLANTLRKGREYFYGSTKLTVYRREEDAE